jgi:hypothetical protein
MIFQLDFGQSTAHHPIAPNRPKVVWWFAGCPSKCPNVVEEVGRGCLSPKMIFQSQYCQL